MDEKQLSDLIDEKIKSWKESQKGQTDGYEYESTFNEMVQYIGKNILQQSIGELPANKKLKKTSDVIRGIRNHS